MRSQALSPVSRSHESHYDASVLVLERAAHTRTAIKKILGPQLLHIHTASNSTEAFAFLDSNPVDLLIAEFECDGDGLNGLGLVEKICRDYARTPLLIVSSVNDLDTAVATMQLGASDYILKPLKEERLI